MVEVFPDQLVYGGQEGASLFLASKLSEFGASSILLVTGKTSYASSSAEAFMKASLTDQLVSRFKEFDPNPALDDLMKGLETFSRFKPDCIVAIGGGSVLDMAKLINFFGSTAVDPTGYLKGEYLSDNRTLLPLIAIPTTSGTGSEATHFSVLYKDKVKYSVAEQCMIPSVAILNPTLTRSMTPYQTACTGMDALAQGIESYWAIGATEESRTFAEKGVRLALKYLKTATLSPDPESREGMQGAAYWSGRAINISKTTLCHALSYSLTSFYGYPHGHAVAVFLPEIVARHLGANAVPQGFLQLFGEENPESYLRKLRDQLGLGIRAPFARQALETVISEVNLERLSNNPVQFSLLELTEIVANSLYRNTTRQSLR